MPSSREDDTAKNVSAPTSDLMINYKYYHVLEIIRRVNDSMSPLHLFFRDYTGAFFAAFILLLTYLAIVLPSSSGQWVHNLFQLHGMVEVDGKRVYTKSVNDIATVGMLTSILLALRYFLSNTLFRIITQKMGIQNSVDQPQIEHKCEVVYHCHF